MNLKVKAGRLAVTSLMMGSFKHWKPIRWVRGLGSKTAERHCSVISSFNQQSGTANVLFFSHKHAQKNLDWGATLSLYMGESLAVFHSAVKWMIWRLLNWNKKYDDNNHLSKCPSGTQHGTEGKNNPWKQNQEAHLGMVWCTAVFFSCVSET